MKSLLLIFFTLSIICTGVSQNMKAEQVLQKTIKFHDPYGMWSTFKDSLQVTMTTPDKSDRVTDIYINLPSQIFKASAIRDSDTTLYHIEKGECFTDKESEKERKAFCDRSEFMKNYYTYLYGLPMKLNDLGTQLNEVVERRKFQSKEYIVLKTTYSKTKGSEIWSFYIDPITFALEIYQFHKADESGTIDLKSGEYILLSELVEISKIKISKIRKWYYNKNDQYLGTDTITN